MEILKSNDFDNFYKLMEMSFPKDEYRNYEEQKDVFNDSNYTAYGLYTTDKEIKAVIAVWELNDIVFVEHFAVNPNFRNCGLGSKILEELKKKYNKTICLEVELPENDIAKRRIGFYERNGFFLNEYPYEQPAFSKDKKSVPLLIMTTLGKIDEEAFEKIKNKLYKDVYKCI